MSAKKRFTMTDDGLLDTRTGKKYIRIASSDDIRSTFSCTHTFDIISLMNELSTENDWLWLELDTHKHPLWSTREAERKIKELVDSLEEQINENTDLHSEINKLRIENMRLKELRK